MRLNEIIPGLKAPVTVPSALQKKQQARSGVSGRGSEITSVLMKTEPATTKSILGRSGICSAVMKDAHGK